MTEFVATTECHPLPVAGNGGGGEVRLLGAVRQVTGAMTRVEMGGARILVDCGIAQGREAAHFPEEARNIDALVLTHGHQDHIGHVPTLLEHGFEKPIYATPATLEIARISLEDSLSIQQVSERDIEKFMARFNRLARPLAYDTLAIEHGISIKLHEAGHILGSASAELYTQKNRVLVSGDLGRPNSPILRDANTVWRNDQPVDLVVMESTYGSRDHEHGHDDIERDLELIVKDAIARRAKILIPAFAIGRTQVLLYFLNELVESGRIPEIPVAIDTPMGMAITQTYKKFERLFDKEALAMLTRGDNPLDFEELFAVKRGRDSAKLHEVNGPMIIIAGSGMCTGGRIINHLKDGLPREDTTVLFVGYQGEGTTGRRIQEAARRVGADADDAQPNAKAPGSVWLDGEEIRVNARVATLKGLSAHADRTELLQWVRKIPNVARVALHHGDVEAQNAFVKFASR
jgi:metallo-beta-lactamase family protein